MKYNHLKSNVLLIVNIVVHRGFIKFVLYTQNEMINHDYTVISVILKQFKDFFKTVKLFFYLLCCQKLEWM